MLAVNVDLSEPIAMHDQVAAEIRRAIALAKLSRRATTPGKGHRCGVAGQQETVLRALHVLRDEGLVEFGSGIGITVSGTPEPGAVVSRIRELLVFARSQGYQRDAVVSMIETLPLANGATPT